jgi:hypothetical protein
VAVEETREVESAHDDAEEEVAPVKPRGKFGKRRAPVAADADDDIPF